MPVKKLVFSKVKYIVAIHEWFIKIGTYTHRYYHSGLKVAGVSDCHKTLPLKQCHNGNHIVKDWCGLPKACERLLEEGEMRWRRARL